MMADSLLSDLHVHTLASGHAFNTLDELATAAKDRGIQVLGVTDHGPSMEGAPTAGYFEMVEHVPHFIRDVQILMGCEANIMDVDGHIDLHEPWASRQRILLAGLHERTPYPRGSSLRENTSAILGAIKHPSVHIISHPYRSAFPVDVEAVADTAAEHHTLLEVNLSLFRSILSQSDVPHRDDAVVATRRMLRRLQDQGGNFVLNSDAHHVSALGADYGLLEPIATLLEFSPESVLNNLPVLLCRFIPAMSIGKGNKGARGE